MVYYAHSKDGAPQEEWQTLKEHLKNTADRARKFGDAFNAGEWTYTIGLIHDIGKYSDEFQRRLKGEKIHVDHSTAGAKEMFSVYGEKVGKLMAYCIAGHHSGLPNHGTAVSTEGTLSSRLNKEIEDYSAFKDEIDFMFEMPIGLPVQPVDKNLGFTLSFFIRMLYSCLVDADFIDTETFMSAESKRRGNNATIRQLNDMLCEYLKGFSIGASKINMKRNEILNRCLHMAKGKTGLYTLTVPTGGGKTYSSIAFALNHAVMNGLERIIYAIPFTSIIEQNAKVFKDVLGNESILEHHSNYQFENVNSEYLKTVNEKLKLACENWDIPIVVTTNVQFFESLFANRSSKCRKLHNIAKSVIIFDEAQMLPIEYLKPCLLSVCELVQNYGATAILCTATQPSINTLLPASVIPVEIIDDPRQLYNDFKKVSVINKGDLDDDALAKELNKLEQVLCIVNTRKHAKEILNRLQGDAFHLSTLMCPLHRQKTLEEIRRLLKGGKPCKVVSTQLIEAGVDVDFPVVYRSLAGIDSIVQSAGRCNREGKIETGKVYVFKPVSEHAKVKGYLERTAKVSEMVLRKYDDPISLDAIDYYFTLLYDIEGKENLDKKGVIDCFEERGRLLEFDFQTAAEKFRLIESNTYSIVIPFDEEADKLINIAKYSPYPLSLARKLQPYTVSVYEYEYKALRETGAVSTINDIFIVLDDFDKNYDKRTGIIIPKATYGEAIII